MRESVPSICVEISPIPQRKFAEDKKYCAAVVLFPGGGDAVYSQVTAGLVVTRTNCGRRGFLGQPRSMSAWRFIATDPSKRRTKNQEPPGACRVLYLNDAA
jgi:hypothetical protein